MRALFLLTWASLWLSMPVSLYGRSREPPGEEDIRGMVKSAPLVFRGQVVQVDLTKAEEEYKEGVATIAVDRWYRSARKLPRVKVHFAYNSGGFSNGHDCSNLLMGSYWIFFAKPGTGWVLELIHDCEGALGVSSLRASHVSGDILSEMEADFRAGLNDTDADARLASIQRLAGVGMRASQDALKELIARGDEVESKWAILADLKTGDISALSAAVPLLLALRHEEQVRQPDGMLVTVPTPYPQPEGEIALAVEKLRDAQAVPALIIILNQATDELARNCAAAALGEIADPRAEDTLEIHLSDPSQYIRYDSLLGLAKITHAEACAIAKPEEAEQAESRCKSWLASRN